ncbi:MAG: YlbF family regulator [Enterococcus sp.]
MIYDEHFFSLEDQMERLVQGILNSQVMGNYLDKEGLLHSDPTVKKLRDSFSNQKQDFELIAPYGKYAPGYKEKMQQTRRAKRDLDLHPMVADFKVAELDLQTALDVISTQIAQSISEQIKVETGNPFFEGKHRGCGGNCHAS